MRHIRPLRDLQICGTPRNGIGGPHLARPGYMCCRACRAESTHSRLRFKRIPEGPYTSVDHYQASQRSTSKGEVDILDPIPPSDLPTNRFCAGCARLLVNQRGGSEYDQVVDVCCEVMYAHCAGENFVSYLYHHHLSNGGSTRV
jgi:hypothetical protein